jgi:hypothetical protein
LKQVHAPASLQRGGRGIPPSSLLLDEAEPTSDGPLSPESEPGLGLVPPPPLLDADPAVWPCPNWFVLVVDVAQAATDPKIRSLLMARKPVGRWRIGSTKHCHNLSGCEGRQSRSVTDPRRFQLR